MENLNEKDLWRMLTLYGLNTATYKIALAECLYNFTQKSQTNISMEMLAKEFFDLYNNRLSNRMPQLSHPTRMTVMERAVTFFESNIMDYDETIDYVKNHAFSDVLPRFHNLFGQNLGQEFYEITDSGIILTDSTFKVFDDDKLDLKNELDARWSLLESSFAMKRENAELINDIKKFYLLRGYERTNITNMKDMLNGYQEGKCFYCGENLKQDSIHVGHVIPRAYLFHDEPWNLVLSHSKCNEKKNDSLPNLYYINKLIDRNERLIKSNHPLSNKICQSLGNTPSLRRKNTLFIYNQILNAVGNKNIWRGSQDFIPENDPFYKSTIAKIMKQ